MERARSPPGLADRRARPLPRAAPSRRPRRSLAPDPDEAVALAGHLADAALAFARAHAYHVPSRPVIVIVADPSLARGQVEVDAGPVQAARSRSVRRGVEPARRDDRSRGRGGQRRRCPPSRRRRSAADAPDAPPDGTRRGARRRRRGVGSAGADAEPGDEPAEAGIRGDGTHTMVYPPAGAARGPGAAPRLRARRLGADHRGRRLAAGPRALGGQPARPRRPRGSRAATGGCRRDAAPSSTSTSAARTGAASTASGWMRSRSAWATASRSATRCSSWRRSLVDVDGFVLTLWLIRILFLVLLYGFLFAVARVLMRDLRAASKGPPSSGGWSCSPRRRPSRRSGPRSRSTPSRRSAATSTTRSSSTTRSRPPSTPC